MRMIRTINTEVRVIDAAKGICEYVASDETLDSYKEVIRANGWKFTNLRKNAPFVDSHDYNTIEKLVGKVVDFAVRGKQLVETVQWAIDVADNKLAQLGWKMTEAGYLKAVSVGFFPVKWVSKWDANSATDRGTWLQQLQELGLEEMNAPRCIYIEQEQVELSSCIIGANPNALAKAYKAGVLDDTGLDMISLENSKRSVSEAIDPGLAELTRGRARERFLEQFERAIQRV